MLAQAKMDLERYGVAWARNGVAQQILDEQEELVLRDDGVVKNDCNEHGIERSHP